MQLLFSSQGWNDYLFWQETDKKMLKKINSLIVSISRDPFNGIGKPESLKYGLSDYWSRRIDQEHRLVYKVEGDICEILQCKGHY